MKKSLLALDLFSGAGGLTLGLKQAGFDVMAAIECDSLAVNTYKRNHPEVEVINNDIRSVSTKSILKLMGIKKGELDLLSGCPPCQGFSTMVSLNGSQQVDDDRNDLVYEMIRFTKDFLPKCILFENVPNLIKDERFNRLCIAIKSLGYSLEYEVRNASNYGVSQRRKRLIVMASRIGEVNFAMPKIKSKLLKDVIGGMPIPGEGSDALHDYKQNHSLKTQRLIALIPKDGGSRTDLPYNEQLDCHKRFNGFRDVYGRMSWSNVAPTITSGCINPSKGRFLHPSQNRAITLREAALIQGFPKNYYFSLERGRHKAASLIANAFPPAFVCEHAKNIYQVIKANNS